MRAAVGFDGLEAMRVPAPGSRESASTLALVLDPDQIARTLRVGETIFAGPEATTRARAVLRRVADTIEPSALFQVDLVLTELVCRRDLDVADDDARDFYLEVSRRRQRLRVELVDDGRPAPSRQGRATPPGRELQLVAELTDRWGMSVDGATTIWFEFALDTDA